MFIGHKNEKNEIQSLHNHLVNVSRLAGRFSTSFCAEAHAQRVGLLHDAGKYSAAAQQRMADPEHTSKVDHSTAGAKIAWEQCKDGGGAIAIAGHHGGMPDLGGRMASAGDGTLMGRLRKDLSGVFDYDAFWKENQIETGMLLPKWMLPTVNPFAGQFYVRMLFSSLVDADFLDTERFMQGDKDRGQYEGMHVLFEKLQAYIQPWLVNPSSEINQMRCKILRNCLDAGKGRRGLYTLTVPTGGGKTVSSLAFALMHAVQNNLDHIIYVIPYTSIIEQNAAVFKSILGDANVIEHHSGIELDVSDDMENSDSMRRMLATENWDAPVIVTTAVQFFDSLYSNKPSRCRKLHNIANSVVIFDEAQMLPLSYLKPCVSVIAELTRHYRTTAVLCTATQPSLDRLFKEYDKDIIPNEICADVNELQEFFRRVHYTKKDVLNYEVLAHNLAQKKQVLCIVNTRITAQNVYTLLPEHGSFHLSTRMTAEHRSKVLDEIRTKLRLGEECRVISTSLIEAGVDVDFPEVWREISGLDSILQAAGRCNREGRKAAQDSEVVIFSLDCGIPKGMQANAAAAESAMEGVENIDDSKTVHRYFEQLYWQLGDQALDAKAMMKICSSMNMKTISENFHLIESDTRIIYIPTNDNMKDIDYLKRGILSRGLMQRLGRSAVNVAPWDWQKMQETGVIEVINENAAILSNPDLYDPACGLKVDVDPGRGLWV